MCCFSETLFCRQSQIVCNHGKRLKVKFPNLSLDIYLINYGSCNQHEYKAEGIRYDSFAIWIHHTNQLTALMCVWWIVERRRKSRYIKLSGGIIDMYRGIVANSIERVMKAICRLVWQKEQGNKAISIFQKGCGTLGENCCENIANVCV